MPRPRLLLVPTLAELEWGVKPLLEEWADVASFDAPGIGDERAVERPGPTATAERGLEELDRLDWDRCFVAADHFAALAAVELAKERPDALQGVALGHAFLSLDRRGQRPSVYPEVADAWTQLLRLDFRTFVRQDLAAWEPRRGGQRELDSGEHDQLIDEYLRRVSPEAAIAFYEHLLELEGSGVANVEPVLRELGVPLLLAEHEGCPGFTKEGYQDAVAAFPDSATVTCPVTPGISPEFADALRSFCSRVEEAEGEGRPPRVAS